MERVGIRQFRDGLTKYLARVRAGESLVVTDHDVPVATVLPAASPDRAAAAALTLEGWVEWHGGKPRGAAQPARVVGGTVADIVLESRR